MVFNRSLLAKAALGPAVGAVLMAFMASGAIPAYQMYSVALAAVYTIVVLSVGLLAGWSGIWSVGHPAFFAIGAYFAAYGSGHGWSLETVVLGAVVTGTVLGAFLGYAGARFSMLYIALLTLAFTMVTLELVNRWSSVTGGDQGVAVLQLRSSLGLGTLAGGGTESQYLAVGAAAVVLALAVPAAASGLRMRLVAAKSHPLAARTIGIAPEAQSALAFAVSAAFTTLRGRAARAHHRVRQPGPVLPQPRHRAHRGVRAGRGRNHHRRGGRRRLSDLEPLARRPRSDSPSRSCRASC